MGRRPLTSFVAFALVFLSLPVRANTALAADGGSGSISLTSLGAAYTQDFDTLTNTPDAVLSSILPTGWMINESGTSVRNDGKYAVGTGSSITGDTYGFGSTGSTERALGALRSGTLVPIFGASFTNNTGGTITSLAISYTGEQWREGVTNRGAADRMNFEYSATATLITAGTFTSFTALNFSSPNTTAAAAALDGNAAANRTPISATISGLAIANGATFFIRWTDFDITGSDDGLAIDDFSLTPSGTTQSSLTVSKAGTGTGTVTSSPAGIGCGTSCTSTSAPYDNGTVVTLSATPDATMTFGGFSANCAPTGPTTCAITISGAATVTATFTAPPQQFSLTLNKAGTGSGTVTSAPPGISCDASCPTASALYNAGTLVTLTQAASAGSAFIAWSANCAPGSPTSCTVTVSAATTVTATFTALTAIHTIQGSGSTSPLVGQVVTTTGIVTGLKSNGFFLQAPDADVDSDPATSEGIFVFTSSAPPAAATVGNLVQVSGKVQEFIPSADPYSPPVTEIGSSPTVSVVASGQPLPAAITLTTADANPSSPLEKLERYEGMRVHVDSLTVTGPTLGSVNEPNATATSRGIFYGVISGVPRPFREPGIQAPEPPALPGIPQFDNNPERIGVNASLTSPMDVTAGAVVTDLSGPLDYSFRTYTILVDAGSAPSATGNASGTAVRAPTAIEFTIASFNAERFFDTINDPSTSDPVLTQTALTNRLNKISLAIRTMLGSPDIIGFEEIENLTTLQAIATKVNSDAVAAGAPDPGYVAYLEEGNDIGGIDSGFLVKTSRVTVIDVTQEGKAATYINPNNNQAELLNDRPALVLRAAIASPIGSPYAVTVIVNHLRSLSGINDASDGNRVRTKRRAQAEWLANYIQSRQTADPSEHIVSVGDYNAFQFNDGYVDSLGTIKGTPTLATQVTLASGDLVNPDLIDLVDTAPADQRYSFIFDGNAQELDHVLITANLSARFRELQWARINADFAETFRNDANSPLRVSDHDPIVAFFSFPDTTPPTITVAQAPSANANSWNNTDVAVTFTCADNVGIASCVGDTTLTAETAGQTVTGTATDTSGNTAMASATIRIDKTAPTFSWTGTLTYTVDQTVAITCAAADALSGPDPALPNHCDGANGPAFSFGLGTHTLTAAATDNAGNGSSASTTFTVSVTGLSLCALTRTFVSDAGIANSLCVKLDAAAASAARGNTKTHDNQLAAYVKEINAQRGKAISGANASTLIVLAGAL